MTLAERPADPDDYPDADPDLLVPSSSVFVKPKRPVRLDDAYQWWAYVPGADWRHPQGPETSAKKLSKHPVVHVAYEDASAYASWAARSCRPRRSGSSRRAGASRAPPTRGATRRSRTGGAWRTRGRATSR